MSSSFKSIFKSALLLFALMFALPSSADCSEQIFYSIHFATLNNLSDVNKQVNSLKEKGKMVFWEKTQVSGMGQFYRVYVGRYKDWNDAATFRDKLKNAGVVGHLGIQWFTETVTPIEDREPPKLIVSKKPAIVQPLYSALGKDRFVDNRDGTVTDNKTSLMWIKNGWRLEFISALSWFEAVDKCKKFKHGKFSDWRLPTIEEWHSLIDTRNQNPALVEPNPFVNVISHMPYWSKSEFTYSKGHTCNKECPFDSYIVMLWSGNIYHQNKNKMGFILPVRTVATPKK